MKLCLLFYLIPCEWDEDLHGVRMEIVDEENCVKMNQNGWGSAHLTGTYNEGIHHWTFKVEHGPQYGHYCLIGIWKTKSAKKATLYPYFTDKKYNGYAYDIQYNTGRLTTPGSPGSTGPKYAVKCKKGDTIEMYLDFNTLMLTYAVNGIYYPNGQRIEETEYKAAITMHGKDDKLRLLAYDNVKSDDILKMDVDQIPVQDAGQNYDD